MDVAFHGVLLDEDSRWMVDHWNVGVTRSSVDGAIVLKKEYSFAGKGSMLSRTQGLRSVSVEVPEARLFPYEILPKVLWTSGLEGLCIGSTVVHRYF